MTITGALWASQGPGRLSAVMIIVFFRAATIPVMVMPLGTYVINRGVVKALCTRESPVARLDGGNPMVDGPMRP